MRDQLDALAFSSRELTEFQERVEKLQADTDILIAGTKDTIAESRRLMPQDRPRGCYPASR